MSHDHIGVPRFIEKGFSKNCQVYVYDVIREKEYKMSIDRLGTKQNYYDKDVEENLLANGIENNFSQLYIDFCNANRVSKKKEILDQNLELVTQFFSFMYMRSKKTLNQVNNESITAKLFGEMRHSDLLRLQSLTKTNPLKIIDEKYILYPIVNNSETLFINNSIGFGMMINKEGKYSFVIPLNTHNAILITRDLDSLEFDGFLIETGENEKADSINKVIVRTEKVIGNGFFFGKEEKSIFKYIEYFHAIKE